jgi:hypothetical protein
MVGGPGFLPGDDLVEESERPIKLIIEQPHRIENFAKCRGCFCPVGSSERKDAVVAQIPHDRRIGNLIGSKASRSERRLGGTGNDLNELENLHLIDRIWQRFRDIRDAWEKVGVGVHETVSHGGPMIEAMIEIADAGLFLGVAREEFGIESHNRFSDGLPFHLAASILG